MPTKKKTSGTKKPVARRAVAPKPVTKTVRRAPKPQVKPMIVAPREMARPMVGPLAAIANFWRGYFNIMGRSTRSEFWFGMLFVVAINWTFAALGMHGGVWTTVATVVSALLFIPTLTLSIRRFRDAGISVWLYVIPMLFVYLIPIIRGPLWAKLIMLEYISSGMIAYSLFVVIFLIFAFVVACLPSKR